MNLKLSGYVTTDKFTEYKKVTSKYLIDPNKVDNNFSMISERLKALEDRKPKQISFFRLNHTTNNYYKDEAEKKLFEKYGGWLKFKKDWIWGFIVTLIIMSSIITIQWFQIHNLEERLNPKELVTESQIKEKQ